MTECKRAGAPGGRAATGVSRGLLIPPRRREALTVLPQRKPDLEPVPRVDGRYRMLFERAPLPYLVTDAGGVNEQSNRAAAVLLRRPAELLVKQSLGSFVPLERRREFRDGLDSLPLVDRAHDWRVMIVPHGGAPVEMAAHVEVADGERPGESVVCWLLRPVAAGVSQLRVFS